jgi:murein DD-endopeptidase MepM/ murein hydrolase activator NlpD
MVGVMVRSAYQQQTNLMPIAVITDASTADLATRMQWSTTMFDTTQAKIDDLLALEAQLKAKRAEMAKAEKKVADDRAEAADSLARTRTLEAQARSAQAAVAGEVSARQAAQQVAAKDVANDKAQYAKLTAERSSVENRIAARIAKEKAAARAAEKAAAARRAAEQAKEARQAASAAKAAKSAKRSSSASRSTRSAAPRPAAPRPSVGSSSSSGAHHGFIYPVSAPITSPYGMRLHPVLHVWKLHDGTDFGAGCGTAMHAAYDGVVSEKYYNAGYGNRLMIDHGRVDGKYVTTGYNHAIRYTVGVGDRVRKGQVIGYVGTTGYSTGCHLHLMVWLNGSMVNPMSWY